MAVKTDSSAAAADLAWNALVEIISDTLQKGESLTLPGFGTFEVHERAARTGRNPDRCRTDDSRIDGGSIQIRCSAQVCGQ